MLWSSKTALAHALTARTSKTTWLNILVPRASILLDSVAGRTIGWASQNVYMEKSCPATRVTLPSQTWSGRKGTKSWLAQGSSNIVHWSRCPIWIKITDLCNTASNLKQSKKLGIIFKTNPGLQLQEARKQPTSGDVTNGFPAKWRLRNDRRNCWRDTCQIWVALLIGRVAKENLLQPNRSSIQIWVVTRHRYGICVLVFQKRLFPAQVL